MKTVGLRTFKAKLKLASMDRNFGELSRPDVVCAKISISILIQTHGVLFKLYNMYILDYLHQVCYWSYGIACAYVDFKSVWDVSSGMTRDQRAGKPIHCIHVCTA